MNTSTVYTRIGAALFTVALMTGCAANMAATGQNGPDMDIVMQETTRLDVERHLGSPVDVRNMSNGHTVALYEAQANIDPNMARAVAHGTLDLFTFGLWEVVGGPGEAYMGRRVEVTVEYDEQGNLFSLDSQQKNVF